MNRKRLAILSILLLIGLELVFMAIYGNYDNNEGWYANDVFLLARGEQPYQDFFYHRLPLFLYSFLPFLSFSPVEWIPLRLISASYFFLGGVVLILLLRRASWAIVIGALGLAAVNLHGLHIYATVQSYAAVSLLFLLAVLFVEKIRNDHLAVALAGVILVIAQWMRYPIDYIPIAFVLYLLICHRKRPAVVATGLAAAAVLHLLLTVLFWSDAFRYDLMLGMFPSRLAASSTPIPLPGNDWKTWLLYKSEWITQGVKWFFPLLVLGVTLTAGFFRNLRPKTVLKNLAGERAVTLSLLLVLGNGAMNFLAPEGHVVQMYFVFPLMIYLLGRLAAKTLPTWGAEAARPLKAAVLVVLLIAPLLFDRDFRLNRDAADTTVVKKIAAEIQNLCPAGEEIFTFTPIVAMEAQRRIARGLEFETFGYFESLDTETAERFHLTNAELLLNRLKNRKICAIHLDDRILNPSGNAVRLKGIQKDLLSAVKQNYRLVRTLDGSPSNLLRGEVQIYLPES
jgi:hypothetical protein